MTDEVRAMIDAKVRDLKTRWQGDNQHSLVSNQERQNPDPSTPVPFARDDKKEQSAGGQAREAGETSPEEVIQAAFQKLKEHVRVELLAHIKAAPPRFFERLVVELMVRLGYGG